MPRQLVLGRERVVVYHVFVGNDLHGWCQYLHPQCHSGSHDDTGAVCGRLLFCHIQYR